MAAAKRRYTRLQPGIPRLHDKDDVNLRGKPGFFWFALAAGILLSGCLVYESVNLFRVGRWQKVVGWRAASEKGGWVVSQVDRDAPAAGRLQTGDRLIAIDGDTRVERTGPLFRLTRPPIGLIA
jgi:hypothetical protein